MRRDVVERAMVLGVATGLRSQTPIAVVAQVAQRHPTVVRRGSVAVRLREPRAAHFTGASAIGEMVADKLPFIPSRLTMPVLGGRILFGALGGAAITPSAHPAWLGAAAGAVGAVAGNFGGYHARVWLGKRTGWPDPAFALVEDTIAVTLSLWAARASVD
ncbi:MAG: DUF4126 family protein [Thermomicrobiales bacterium]